MGGKVKLPYFYPFFAESGITKTIKRFEPHLMLGILVILRHETLVGCRLLLPQLLTHARVAELTQSPHWVTQTQAATKVVAADR